MRFSTDAGFYTQRPPLGTPCFVAFRIFGSGSVSSMHSIQEGG